MSTGKYHEPRASESLDVSDVSGIEKIAHSDTRSGGREGHEPPSRSSEIPQDTKPKSAQSRRRNG